MCFYWLWWDLNLFKCLYTIGEGSIFSENISPKRTSSKQDHNMDMLHHLCPGSPSPSALSMVDNGLSLSAATESPSSCKITTLLLVVHAGSILGKRNNNYVWFAKLFIIVMIHWGLSFLQKQVPMYLQRNQMWLRYE